MLVRTKVHAVGEKKVKYSVLIGQKGTFFFFFSGGTRNTSCSVFVISGGGAHEVLLFLSPQRIEDGWCWEHPHGKRDK